MGRSLKKGPFVDQKLLIKIDDMNDSGQKRPDQNLVAPLNDHAGLRRAYFSRS